MTGKCQYCNKTGPIRVNKDESFLKEDLFVCDMHWSILKDPKMAVPFLRGALASELRGTAFEHVLTKQTNAFVDMIKSWKRTADSN